MRGHVAYYGVPTNSKAILAAVETEPKLTPLVVVRDAAARSLEPSRGAYSLRGVLRLISLKISNRATAPTKATKILAATP